MRRWAAASTAWAARPRSSATPSPPIRPSIPASRMAAASILGHGAATFTNNTVDANKGHRGGGLYVVGDDRCADPVQHLQRQPGHRKRQQTAPGRRRAVPRYVHRHHDAQHRRQQQSQRRRRSLCRGQRAQRHQDQHGDQQHRRPERRRHLSERGQRRPPDQHPPRQPHEPGSRRRSLCDRRRRHACRQSVRRQCRAARRGRSLSCAGRLIAEWRHHPGQPEPGTAAAFIWTARRRARRSLPRC